MVMLISGASSSPNFHSGNNCIKKWQFLFLVICANFPGKIEKFELEVVGVGILGKGFGF